MEESITCDCCKEIYVPDDDTMGCPTCGWCNDELELSEEPMDELFRINDMPLKEYRQRLEVLDSGTEEAEKLQREIIEQAKNDQFRPEIRRRGEEYYDSGEVVSCARSGRDYFAKVSGNCENLYDVHIRVNPSFLAMDCSCPCDFSCKHEYAVLLAIEQHEYREIELKPYIAKRKIYYPDLIEKIPAEELKAFLLTEDFKLHCGDLQIFYRYFSKYVPRQSYEYYYNRLFNALTLDSEGDELIREYFGTVEGYLYDRNYEAAFEILKSFIEAEGDTGCLERHDQDFLGLEMAFERLLRIVAEKADGEMQRKLAEWLSSLEERSYFGNIYLESTAGMLRRVMGGAG